MLRLLCVNFSVERFDPRNNRWTPVASMGTRRKHLGVAVFNNMIYAVGGRDDTTELSSAERYNSQTNSWQPVVAMTSRRSGVSLSRVSCTGLSVSPPHPLAHLFLSVSFFFCGHLSARWVIFALCSPRMAARSTNFTFITSPIP